MAAGGKAMCRVIVYIHRMNFMKIYLGLELETVLQRYRIMTLTSIHYNMYYIANCYCNYKIIFILQPLSLLIYCTIKDIVFSKLLFM